MFKRDSHRISAGLLRCSKYSDLTLICEDQRFSVHRAVICPQSPVIAAACDGNFVEASSGNIHVTATDSITLDRMLEYLYTGAYNDDAATAPKVAGMKRTASESSLDELPGSQPNASSKDLKNATRHQPRAADQTNSALVIHSRVYAIADYYQIFDLKSLAAANFASRAKNCVVKDFADVIKEVYHSTPDIDTTLRSVVCKMAAKDYRVFIKDTEFMAALSEDGNFAKEFVQALVARQEDDLTAQLSLTQAALNVAQDRLSQLGTASAIRKKLQDKFDTVKAGIVSTQSLVNGAGSCPNCRTVCNAQLELDAVGNVDEPKLQPICRGCKTRYKLNSKFLAL